MEIQMETVILPRCHHDSTMIFGRGVLLSHKKQQYGKESFVGLHVRAYNS